MDKLAEIKVETDGGPWATHNYPCPVYRDQNAVIDLSTGFFHPSRLAQRHGWRLIHCNTWLKKKIFNLFFNQRFTDGF